MDPNPRHNGMSPRHWAKKARRDDTAADSAYHLLLLIRPDKLTTLASLAILLGTLASNLPTRKSTIPLCDNPRCRGHVVYELFSHTKSYTFIPPLGPRVKAPLRLPKDKHTLLPPEALQAPLHRPCKRLLSRLPGPFHLLDRGVLELSLPH